MLRVLPQSGQWTSMRNVPEVCVGPLTAAGQDGLTPIALAPPFRLTSGDRPDCVERPNGRAAIRGGDSASAVRELLPPTRGYM